MCACVQHVLLFLRSQIWKGSWFGNLCRTGKVAFKRKCRFLFGKVWVRPGSGIIHCLTKTFNGEHLHQVPKVRMYPSLWNSRSLFRSREWEQRSRFSFLATQSGWTRQSTPTWRSHFNWSERRLSRCSMRLEGEKEIHCHGVGHSAIDSWSFFLSMLQPRLSCDPRLSRSIHEVEKFRRMLSWWIQLYHWGSTPTTDAILSQCSHAQVSLIWSVVAVKSALSQVASRLCTFTKFSLRLSDPKPREPDSNMSGGFFYQSNRRFFLCIKTPGWAGVKNSSKNHFWLFVVGQLFAHFTGIYFIVV